MSTEEKMIGWLEEVLRKEALDKVIVSHVRVDGKRGDEVVTIVIDPEDKASSSPAGIAERVFAAAERDASALGGVQRYVAQTLFLGEDKPRGRFAFRCAGEADEDGIDEDAEALSEPPSARGMVAQSMRHAEAFARMATMGASHMIEMQARTIAKQNDTIQKLVDEKLATIDAVEELRSRKHERDMAEKELEARQENTRQIVDAVRMLLPVALNKLVGGDRPLLPGAKSTSELSMDAFLESITPDQLPQLLSVMTPAQQAAVMAIMQQKADAERAKQEEKKS